MDSCDTSALFWREILSMPAPIRFAFLAALLVVVATHDARADKKTVCTITVNSPDEKETFRRSLRRRLSICRMGERGQPTGCVACARLSVRSLISGHFDDGTEFTRRLDARESFLRRRSGLLQ